MRVLVGILKYPPDFTGAGLRIHNLYKRLREQGVKTVHVITSSEQPIVNYFREIDGIKVHYVGHNKFIAAQGRFVGKVAKARFVIASIWGVIYKFSQIQKDVDLVHTIDSSWLSTAVGWCAFFWKKPLVKEIVLLGCDDPVTIAQDKKVVGNIFLFPFRYASLVITISKALKDACILAGLPEDKVWSRLNPTYLEDKKSEIDSRFVDLSGIDFNMKTILWVGIIQPRKQIDFLLRTAAHLSGEVQLLFVGPIGDRDYFQSLEKLAEDVRASTQNRIKSVFPGWVTDRSQLRELYRKASLFWFASKKEGLGNVVLEALLCGTPVVTLPIDGIMYEVITLPLFGTVVATEDPAVFAGVINNILFLSWFDREMIAQKASKIFDSNVIEQEYLARFRSVVESNITLRRGCIAPPGIEA